MNEKDPRRRNQEAKKLWRDELRFVYNFSPLILSHACSRAVSDCFVYALSVNSLTFLRFYPPSAFQATGLYRFYLPLIADFSVRILVRPHSHFSYATPSLG